MAQDDGSTAHTDDSDATRATDSAADSDPTDDSDASVHTDATDVVPPSCVLGYGETDLTPLVANQEVEVTIGPQNGWHVWGSVRCAGIDPGVAPPDDRNEANPLLTWHLVDAETEAFLGGFTALHQALGGGSEPERFGVQLVLRTPTYAEVVDRDVVMVFHLVDAKERTVSMRLPLHLVAEPDWVPDTDL